jgi:hypothetical protein
MSVGFIKFDDVLTKHLNTPEAVARYEYKKKIFDLEVKFNKELQKAGINGYVVRVEEDEDDY